MSMKHLLLLVLFVCFSCIEPNVKDMLGDDFGCINIRLHGL